MFDLKKQIKWNVIYEGFNDSRGGDNLSYFMYAILICQSIYLFLSINFVVCFWLK